MEIHFTEMLSIAVLLMQGRCTFCQTLTGPTEVAVGDNAVFTCTASGALSPTFIWIDATSITNIFAGGSQLSPAAKYDNFEVSEAGDTSTMTITGAETGATLGDDGSYRCQVTSESPTISLVVEVGSTTRTLNVSAPCIAGSTCTAQCDAVGGKPQETITWSMSGVTVDTNPTNADPDLTNTRSVLTFTATSAPDGQNQTLECNIGGHEVSALNGAVSVTLDVQYPPVSDDIEVTFDENSLDVTCTVLTQANPFITNYWIYQGSELKHESNSSVRTVQLSALPLNFTVFMCVAGNYLGNATDTVEFDPEAGVSAAAVAGGICGALFVIILVVVLVFLWKKGTFENCGSSDDSNKVSTEKPTTQAYRDETIELKNETVQPKNAFTTESAPQAAPRKIEHTTDNLGGDEYAMVSKPPAARGNSADYADGGQNGKGQPDTGMHYADIDLSKGAGHTEQRVPQNPNDVVVYSSILV